MAVLAFRHLGPADLDTAKAVRMALIHDVVEIDAGDVYLYGDQSGKKENEEKALLRLTGLLPESVAVGFREDWNEFEERRSNEAKFVAALDRFLPLLSNVLNQGSAWKKHGISSEQVIAKNRPLLMDGLPALWAVAEKMIEESVKRGELIVKGAAADKNAENVPRP